ncbi:S8 family serine peptidase [Marivirga arenosa]|uniref:S8 family serine peptidase n=1 Tax=Marivirga arenosa TaxID=3059076 RepID=A0AA51X4P6_9BACT|nr:S8 family serine peptidase [Marivirga sp. BKB1-2]WNB16891.1 S8 family serine peptidase [Marivirga sp. BKB1-2]
MKSYLLTKASFKINLFLYSLFLYFLIVNNFPLYGQGISSNSRGNYIIDKQESLNSIKNQEYYLVHFDSDSNLLKKNFSSIRRLKNNDYIVRVDNLAELRYKTSKNDISIYKTNNNWKKSSNITILNNDLLNGVYWIESQDKQKCKNFLASNPKINTILTQNQFFKIHVDNVILDELLNKSFISYIEKVPQNVKSEARVLDLNLNPNKINTIQAYYQELDGSGEVVSVREPFYTIEDIDLQGRYIQTGLESEFSDNHALEMATMIAGNGNSFLTGLGVATNAQHTSSSNAEVSPNNYDYFSDNNIQTQNHSYGTVIESFYGVDAALYDQLAFEHKEIINVFSIGNSGLETAQEGVYVNINGYANITGNFKQAKNILTIGAVDTAMNLIDFNSNGPAFDGRIKPELVAYSMAGTSNAAALVSGTSVLMQQAFKDKYNTQLNSALLKAILINEADDIGLLGPDHKTGFGSLNSYSSVNAIYNESYIESELVNIKNTHTLKRPINASQLKMTLVWTDPPASPNDAYALVNDLDLKLIDANGKEYLPWVLSTEASLEALSSSATLGEDHINNIEQVYINKIETDSVKIIVSTNQTTDITQPYSIAYKWITENEFSWTSPTFKDNIPYNGETASHIRWESTFDSKAQANLFFKLVGESEWTLIEENLNLSAENYRWNPIIYNDFAQLKMEINQESFVSDTFPISSPIRLNVGLNCSDSISLNWNRIEGADYYKVYNLNSNELLTISQTSDSSITLLKSNIESDYFKVQAFKNDKALINGVLINYTQQGANCYLNSYYLETVQSEGIYQNIQLASLNGIRELSIEKRLSDGNWNVISTFTPENFENIYLDENPDNGFNYYRIVIHFENGQEIISQTESAYYVKDSNFIIYPNPWNTEEDLKVFSKEELPNAIITFINSTGQEIGSFSIPRDRNFLQIEILEEGLYFYRISNQEEIISSGKLLIKR